MALSGSITTQTNWVQTPSGVPGALPAETRLTLTWTVTSGTGADQADLKYSTKRTLAISTPLVLDLTSLTDAQGVAIAPARLKALTVVNRSTTPGQVLKLGYSATTANAFTGFVTNPGQVTVRPSTTSSPGFVTITAPDATGFLIGSTNKLLQIDPGANAILVEIELILASV